MSIEIKDTKEFGKIVRISDVRGLNGWLVGQTMPYVEWDETPMDWAYYSDFERFINYKPKI